MTAFSALRVRRSTWGRFVSGLVMVAWMNVMLQPCAMAMTSVAEPDAMPAMHMEHGEHSQHVAHEEHTADRACPQCDPATAPQQEACDAVLMEDCSSLSDYNNDGRSSDPKPKDAATVVAHTSLFDKTNFIVEPRSMPARQFDRPTISSGPPLNVRFCVYLK